jgi:general secretion pathway protein E
MNCSAVTKMSADYLAKLLSPEIKGGGGLILLSGPTGSGKTTTLYACVQQIDRRRKHVLTIEDPIEYELRYATQWQVRPGMPGGSFADLIRAAMRHDPDYIIIGEMRDADTVETALRAAESGHTVISTVHADTALQTFERLRSLMPTARERSSTYTLAQQVRCILNQRLLRTLCQGCSHKDTADNALRPEEIRMLGVASDVPVRRHNTSGCDLCNRTGISGRTLLLDALDDCVGTFATKRYLRSVDWKYQQIDRPRGRNCSHATRRIGRSRAERSLLIRRPRFRTSKNNAALIG